MKFLIGFNSITISIIIFSLAAKSYSLKLEYILQCLSTYKFISGIPLGMEPVPNDSSRIDVSSPQNDIHSSHDIGQYQPGDGTKQPAKVAWNYHQLLLLNLSHHRILPACLLPISRRMVLGRDRLQVITWMCNGNWGSKLTSWWVAVNFSTFQLFTPLKIQ